MNPYDTTTGALDLRMISASRSTPRTALAIGLTPIIWAMVYSLLISSGIEEICDRHPQASDMPIGYWIFAVAFLLITIPVNYFVVAVLFRPIVRFPNMRFGSDLIALLCVAALVATSLATLAVSAIPGLTPLQQDRDALTRPFVTASLISALAFFGLTRDRVLAVPATLFHSLQTQALYLWPKKGVTIQCTPARESGGFK